MIFLRSIFLLLLISINIVPTLAQAKRDVRERIRLTDGWKFYRYKEGGDSLIYDVRPEVTEDIDKREADAKPVEGDAVHRRQFMLKPWILPTGNEFLKNQDKIFLRPEGSPGKDFPFVKADLDESNWQDVTVPHDWAARGEFYKGGDAPIGGSMGRLPVQGVAWYRKKITIPETDKGRSLYLEIDGAMSYSMVWINGELVGGWPYGYASYRVDLTPYIRYGVVNQVAIRLDNPPSSSRWYPGAGLYRNVWLTKTSEIQVDQWGTTVKTNHVTKQSATIDLDVAVKNRGSEKTEVTAVTACYLLNEGGARSTSADLEFGPVSKLIGAGEKLIFKSSAILKNPKLWGPYPEQRPSRYVAVTNLYIGKRLVDSYESKFGIRDLRFDATKGLLVNGQAIVLRGVNQHHDLGALGVAFNRNAAERQLDLLREAGSNAIRMAHNPPASELLELTDSLGFLVVDEIFDNWRLRKTPLDFHLIFDDWHEQDIRAFIRRDRNHPSVIMWSYGNEVGEQYTGEEGCKLSAYLNKIVKEEDLTRPTTVSMNYAKADMPFSSVADIISLNYQGEGIRNAPAYRHLKGINAPPSFPKFREIHPDRMIISSENAAAVSSRGEYFFPVYRGQSAPVEEEQGGENSSAQVSSYELYSVPFGSSADKVFATMADNSYVAGGFVWSGWDYLGEPTPYYQSKNSYFGIVDLAGFKKDRFFLYQSYWRPDFPMAHILPHWNWREKINDTIPVHVFTSGDEAELFLNGRSLGRKGKRQGEYRLRWDDVVYQPGELHVVAYKQGQKWAESRVRTTQEAKALKLTPNKKFLHADGEDLIFVTVDVVDKFGDVVPRSKNELKFAIQGPGEIIATDNGDSNDLVSFASLSRKAFNGKALAIIKAKKGEWGPIKLLVVSPGLTTGMAELNIK